jgi:TnpA family transposase
MGMVKPFELTTSLHRSGRTSTLERAIGELGRIEKTFFLLSWVADISYRRRFLIQITRMTWLV